MVAPCRLPAPSGLEESAARHFGVRPDAPRYPFEQVRNSMLLGEEHQSSLGFSAL